MNENYDRNFLRFGNLVTPEYSESELNKLNINDYRHYLRSGNYVYNPPTINNLSTKITENPKTFLNGCGVFSLAGIPTQITGLTLCTSYWTTDASLKKYVLCNSTITSESVVEIIPTNTSIDVVKTAEILPEILTNSGSVSIWAKNIPTENITVTLNIF